MSHLIIDRAFATVDNLVWDTLSSRLYHSGNLYVTLVTLVTPQCMQNGQADFSKLPQLQCGRTLR